MCVFTEFFLGSKKFLLVFFVTSSSAFFKIEEVSPDTYINIMDQYRPTFVVGKGEKRARHGFTTYSEIDRPINSTEWQSIRDHAEQEGLWRFEDNLWIPNPDL